MKKEEASLILSDELLEVLLLLQKVKANSVSLKRFYAFEEQRAGEHVKLSAANHVNSVNIEYLERACFLLEHIAD